MKNEIPIFFTIDEGYAAYLSVALASLIDHAKSQNNYIVHIVHQGVLDESMAKLKSLETDNVKIKFTDIAEKIKPIENKLKEMLSKTHFQLPVYFRLFLPVMFPEYDKGIYIDSDTVLNADIAELYNFDLKDNVIGGIPDISISEIAPFLEYIKNAVGVPDGKYINSGVLVMNMKKLRDIKFESHFLYILNKYNFEVVAPDQDYINALCKDNILYIPYEWNAMPIEGKKGIDNPKLIHYNLFLKPWHYKDIAYEEYFWNYANKSLFKEKIQNEIENYTDEKKQKDHEQIEFMLKQAKSIEEKDVTFKSVFESGMEKRLGE